MKVKVIKAFIDREADMKRRNVKEVFDVEEKRAEYLIERKVVKKVEPKDTSKEDTETTETETTN